MAAAATQEQEQELELVWHRGGGGGLLGLRPCRAVAAGAAGLRRLRKEVRSCEYSDVYVMWEMLSVSEPDTGGKGAAAAAAKAKATRRRARSGRKAVVAAWSRLAFYCCAF